MREEASFWSALLPEHYTDPAVLRREGARVFANTWQPIGLKEHLASDQDYICADVAGRGVVVQNFHGTLRAFENVCTHRQSPIHTCGHGRRPLQCPYHGWTFDENGRPTGIPQRRSFGALPVETADRLALAPWAFETLGPLVFVNSDPNATSLRASLGSIAGELEATINRAVRTLDTNTFELACNWKLMLENGLEAYHIPLVHPATLRKHGLRELERTAHGEHSVSRFVAQTSERVLRALRYAFHGAAVSDRYTHYLIFPNTYVVNVYDLFLAISRMNPIDAERTRFESFVFVTWDGAGGNVELREELNASNAAFFRQGYQEDRQICERVQGVLRNTNRRALFGAAEERIPMFHDAWARRMRLESAS